MDFVKADRPRFKPATTLTGLVDSPVIDTGVEIHGFGRVYVGLKELRVMAHLVGWTAPEQVDELRAAYAETEADLEAARAELARIRPVYDAVMQKAVEIAEATS